MTPSGRVRHLARRFFGMLSQAPVPAADRRWVDEQLLAPERALWSRLSTADQRHSIEVARRFVAGSPHTDRPEVAAALLHDIGKLDSGLGVVMRVVATIVGPRTERFRRYHDHERIGAQLLRDLGSDPRTVALVDGSSTDVVTLQALHAADDL